MEIAIDRLGLSNCCDAPIYWDTDICSCCKEHCISHFDEMEMRWEDERNEQVLDSFYEQ